MSVGFAVFALANVVVCACVYLCRCLHHAAPSGDVAVVHVCTRLAGLHHLLRGDCVPAQVFQFLLDYSIYFVVVGVEKEARLARGAYVGHA